LLARAFRDETIDIDQTRLIRPIALDPMIRCGIARVKRSSVYADA
jgi:hypothetical protein